MSINLSLTCTCIYIIKSADLVLMGNVLQVMYLCFLIFTVAALVGATLAVCLLVLHSIHLEHSVDPHTCLVLSCWIADGRLHAFRCVCHMKLC